MDAVFKALSDPTRRRLLDMLFRRDGQTLGQLERRLEMTRFGVMKHLRVLEQARLIVTKRRGREKLHFLNAVPIRQIHDRWIDKYSAPVAAMLTGLKKAIEEDAMERVYQIYIKTTPQRLWQAITDPSLRAKYSFGVATHSDWTPGSRYQSRTDRCHGRARHRHRRRREPRGGPASPSRADVPRALERRGQGRGVLARHVGDRADRRFVPSEGDARSAACGCESRNFMVAGRWSCRGSRRSSKRANC